MGSTASVPQESAVSSAKSSEFSNSIQNMCNFSKLPAMYTSFNWTKYLHKKSMSNFETPHERLIIESGKYLLCIELSNTDGGSSGLTRGDFKISTKIVGKYESRDEWEKYGTANFALQHLVTFVDNVTNDFGYYNVITNNCQTFARSLANEMGGTKTCNKINDGTKGVIGASSASAVVGSGLFFSAAAAPN